MANTKAIVAAASLVVGGLGLVWMAAGGGPASTDAPTPATPDRPVAAPVPPTAPVAAPSAGPRAPSPAAPTPAAAAQVRLDRNVVHDAVDAAAAEFDGGFDAWAAEIDPADADAVARIAADFYAEVAELLDRVGSGEVSVDAGGLRRELKGVQGRANSAMIAELGLDGMGELSDATGFGRQVLVPNNAVLPAPP